MQRELQDAILRDLDEKIVLLTGPRQVGKTTLARQLYEPYEYYNFDVARDRTALKAQSWLRTAPLVIFDELHKMRQWKRWIKGIYDTEGVRPRLLITGSAKLDTYRKVGDSLAGRYFQYRLHPFTLNEAIKLFPALNAKTLLERLLACGGFPEPFIKGEAQYYQRWRNTHLDIILRQDLLDIHAVRDIQAIETLVELLKERVGSTIVYANLARDLERDIHTIQRWLLLLENLYVIFKVTPYHKNIARALLKAPKYYFYDIAQVSDKTGARFENLIASALLRELHRQEDYTGIHGHLHYVRTKEGKEIDFLVRQDQKVTHLIEAKWADNQPSSAFRHFESYFPDAKNIQVVYELDREKQFGKTLSIFRAERWLSGHLIDE